MKKIMAILLSLCVVLAYMPMMAFAAGSETNDGTAVAQVETTADAEEGIDASNLFYSSITEAIDSVEKTSTLTVLTNCVATGTYMMNTGTLAVPSGKVLKLQGEGSLGTDTRVENDGTIIVDGELDLRELETTTEETGAGLVLAKSGKLNLTADAVLTMPIWFADWNKTPGASDCIFGSVAEGAVMVIDGDGTYSYTGSEWTKNVAEYDGTNYSTVAAAIGAANANALSSTKAVITILQDVNEDITIDAATMEYKLKGTNVKLSGDITVTKGSLILDGGTYEGTVTKANDAEAKLSVIAGTFDKTHNPDIATYLATGSYATTGESAIIILKSEKSLNGVTVTGLQSAYVGSTTTATQPTGFVVKDGTTTLTKNTDYTVSYGTNKLASSTATSATGTIILTGKGQYAGSSKTITFDILKTARSMSKATVAAIPNVVYSTTVGTYGATPTPVVTWKETSTSAAVTLVQGQDYTVSYSGNKAVGTATVTITGNGGYSGTCSGTFQITGNVNLNASTITAVADQAYTGSAIKPALTVTYGRTYLTENVDYTVTYSSNISVGTATATITGKGQYTGTNSTTFKIKYNLSSATVTPSATSFKWDGTVKAPTVTSVKYGTTTLTANTDYVVSSTATNKNVGTYTVTISAPATSTRTMGSTTFTYKITGDPQTITGVSSTSSKTMASDDFVIKPSAPDATGYTYTSSDSKVATVAANGLVEIMGIGKTTITVTTTGNVSHEAATKTMTLTVKPKKMTIKSVTSAAAGKMTVKYRKQPGGITGTQIRYSTKADFSSYKTYTNKVGNDTDVTKIGTKTLTVKPGKTYYVKTRNYKTLEDGTKLYGSWSTAKKVVVK